MRILQIFNQYLELGGEEGSVDRIAKAIRSKAELHTFYGSTATELAHPLGRLRMPFLMQKNRGILSALTELQKSGQFDFWQIHNVFPAISVAVYELATELGIPVVQYLHNYRFSCVDATFFRDGKVCRECSPGNLTPGVIHGCWRGSRIASLAMAAAIRRTWKSGSLDSIKGFIAISESQKREHVAMGIPAQKIAVVPHFLEARTELTVPVHGSGDVLFIGRMTQEKGAHLLLNAWSQVNSHGRTLRMVGDGPELANLRAQSLRLGLKNVIFEGFVPQENHAELWSKAAFFVAPSTWLEPFGMVVLESWKHSRPVLATNHGSFPDMISHGKDGWLAEPNPEDFSKVLQQALDSGSELETMGHNGRSTLLEKFNEQIWLERIFTAYEKFGISD